MCGKLPNLSGAGTRKNFLKEVYQLFFEFIIKVVLQRSEKRTITSGLNLCMMESLSKLETINLLAIILENLYKLSQ